MNLANISIVLSPACFNTFFAPSYSMKASYTGSKCFSNWSLNYLLVESV